MTDTRHTGMSVVTHEERVDPIMAQAPLPLSFFRRFRRGPTPNHESLTTGSGPLGLKFVASLLFLLGLAMPSLALEVREVRWGFNNAIKFNAFNLCSIELMNPTANAFQSPIQLKPSGGFSRGENIPYTELNVYIGPGETRTVQFVPYVSKQSDEWEVRWGESDQERYLVPDPNRKISAPVAVQLIARQGTSSPLTGIEAFPEEDFPIGAAGTETLGCIVLDHVPQRWDVTRTRAFRDWLGRGGRLFLIQGRDGKPLEFPAALSELNFPGDRFLVGQGTVTRHTLVQNAAEIEGLASRLATTENQTNTQDFGYNQYEDPAATASDQLFETLRLMTRPEHNWSLIFLLAMVYLVILFPGIWLFSRKRGDYRVTYGLILATVVIFSWFYSEIGKRGYNESTGLREMMVAYPLGNQRLALKKYCSLFVTSGGQYPLKAKGEGAVVSVSSGFSGRVDAGVINRPEAGFVPDIPPYSACSYLESSVLPTQQDFSVQVKTLEIDPQLKKLEVTLGAGIPPTAQVYLISNDEVRTLTLQGTHWVTTSPPEVLSSKFPVEYMSPWTQLSREQCERNLLACLVQIGTQTRLLDQPNFAPSNVTINIEAAPAPPADSPKKFEGGHLLVYCDPPAELLPADYPSNGKVLFVSAIDPSQATPATSP